LKVCIKLFINSRISHTTDAKDKKMILRSKTKKTFNTLKKSLSETVHLVIFQLTCKKILEINTSDFAVNACLYQIKDEVQRFIVFQSRKLSKFKKKYRIHDKELLVIVKVLQE